MDPLLTEGTRLAARRHGFDCRVLRRIGAGGQGEVYLAEARHGEDTQRLALKWYFPEWARREQATALERLVASGPPGRRFLWPIDLVTVPGRDGFGYLMPLRPERFTSCTDVMSGRRQIGFRQVVLACLELSDCFLGLHAKGMCYRDISFGNVFVDTTTGHVLICDNDNVDVQGSGTPGIQGTDRFMAPEVVRGEAAPGSATDLYSLSVLLFYLLMMHHPLEGRQLGGIGVLGRAEAAEVYGRRPVFVFDPDDPSNRPDPEEDPNVLVFWPLYPQFVRDLFTRAFTDGLRNPLGGRIRESQWRDAMAQLLDVLVPCVCGADVFSEPDGRQPHHCWSCGRRDGASTGLPRLLLHTGAGTDVVVLHEGKLLHGHHLGGTRFDYTTVMAEVVRHPQAPDVRGLRNLTGRDWLVRAPAADTAVTVPPQRSFTLEAGTQVSFGAVEGLLAP